MRKLQGWWAGIKVNRVIQFLTYSDVLIFSGWGLVSPILAVFFTDQIKGGSVALAGLASTVYFAVKSVAQIPIARWIDRRSGEGDDFWTMMIGSGLGTLASFLYIWITQPWQVYVVQVIYGLGGALSFPSWLAIFTRHVDKREEGLEWSLYYTATDITGALTAGLGGLLATTVGFRPLFAVVGVTNLMGTLLLLGVIGNMRRQT